MLCHNSAFHADVGRLLHVLSKMDFSNDDVYRTFHDSFVSSSSASASASAGEPTFEMNSGLPMSYPPIGFGTAAAISTATATATTSSSSMAIPAIIPDVTNLSESAIALKKRKVTTKIACVPCVKAKVRCGTKRPCQRCVQRGQTDRCVDRGSDAEVEEEPKSSRSRYKRISVPACLHCKLSKSACNVESPCKRCLRLDLPCLRQSRKASSSSSSIPAFAPAQSRSAIPIQDDEITTESVCRNPVPVFSAMSVPSRQCYQLRELYDQFMLNIEFYSPFAISEFFGNSTLSSFSSLVGIILFYLPKDMSCSILRKMSSCANSCLSSAVSSRPIAELKRLQDPNLLVNAVPSVKIDLAHDVETGFIRQTSQLDSSDSFYLDHFPFPSIFPFPFLEGKPVGVIYLKHPSAESKNSLMVEPHLNSHAESILGYSSEEFADLCLNFAPSEFHEGYGDASPLLR
jgi:hypothetical protein